MRLDHLLSKEHVTAFLLGVWCRAAPGQDGAPVVGVPRVAWVVLEGGTLTRSAGARSPLLVRLVFGRVGNVVGMGWPVVGTLLGPEGTGRPASVGWWCF